MSYAMHHEITTVSEPPEIVLQWISQLLNPDFIALLSVCPLEKIDVRLAASKGRVSKSPMVVINGGPQEFQNL